MQYGQIVFILFVAMACYYVFLIFTDIRTAQAAQNAEKENHTEEEIDISDEAKSFRPTRVSRDEEEGRGGWQRAIRTGLTPRKSFPPSRLP